jgi:hypothetical protein
VRAGMDIDVIYGGYDVSPLGVDSRRMIVVAKRTARGSPDLA